VAITTSRPDGGEFAISLTVSGDHDRATLGADVSAAVDAAQPDLFGTRHVQVWIEDVNEGDDARLAPELRPYRDLLQLRRPLPAPPSGLDTRAFDPTSDPETFIAVNNRAFAWHPEQAGLTRDRLDATMREPWFDADGFRILEVEGRMAGFCWTKIHVDNTPPLGEIYVIAVDPDFHGRGLGGPMTLAGLEWLAGRQITIANLYVESDNHPALRTYERIGFTHHSTNRAYTSAPS